MPHPTAVHALSDPGVIDLHVVAFPLKLMPMISSDDEALYSRIAQLPYSPLRLPMILLIACRANKPPSAS